MSERGSALIVVSVLMGLVAVLAAGLALGASTVAAVSRNHEDAALVRAVADGAAEQAVAVALPGLQRWRADGFSAPSAALTDVIRRGRLWRALMAAGLPAMSGDDPGGSGATLSVEIVDDDATGRGLAPADVVRIGEDGQAGHDVNGLAVVRAVAQTRHGATATVEAMFGAVPPPAATLRGRTRVSGLTLGGRGGHLAVLGDLDVGPAVDVSGSVTATGTIRAPMRPTAPEGVRGHARAALPPDVRPEDFQASADFVLRRDGTASLPAVAGSEPLCRPPEVACPLAARVWRFDAGEWWLTAPPPAPATVFVDGDARITLETGLLTPVRLSVIAAGSLDVGGIMAMHAVLPGVLFVAGGDLRVEGTLVADGTEALVAAGEQVWLRGPIRLRGALVAAGRSQMSGLVTENELSGGVAIIADGGLAQRGWVTWKVLGWRREQAW